MFAKDKKNLKSRICNSSRYHTVQGYANYITFDYDSVNKYKKVFYDTLTLRYSLQSRRKKNKMKL